MSDSFNRKGTMILHAIAVTLTLAIASGYLPQASGLNLIAFNLSALPQSR